MLKYLLYVKNNNIDGEIKFSVDGAQLDTDTGHYVGKHDPNRITTIKINLDCLNTKQSYLQIEKLVVGDVILNNMDKWSTYILEDGSISEYTNGWLAKSGTFYIKIKYSPLVQNYMSYFLNTCSNK